MLMSVIPELRYITRKNLTLFKIQKTVILTAKTLSAIQMCVHQRASDENSSTTRTTPLPYRPLGV
jgi:hypothetical protein